MSSSKVPVIPAVLETHVFVNEHGDISISQTDPWSIMDGDDVTVFISFPVSLAETMVTAIRAAAEEVNK